MTSCHYCIVTVSSVLGIHQTWRGRWFIVSAHTRTYTHRSHLHRMEWKETARWIKFEEDVEEGGNKWSKPHVATLSLHSLFELRGCLLKGTVLLDMQADNLTQISGKGERERERESSWSMDYKYCI